MKVSRRSFLKRSTATTLSLAVHGGMAMAGQIPSGMSAGPGNKWPGRVVVNFNKNAISGTSTPVTAVIQKMVDDAILRLTDQSTIGAAWKALFPSSLTAQSKIAIKVFCAEPRVPSHWSSVKAITDGLQQMNCNGVRFPAANIALYEGNASNRFSEAGFTAANFPGISLEYWAAGRFVTGGDGAFSNRAYAPTLKNANFLINVFSPRGHSIGSTFTIGFKNHFGTYELNTNKTGDLHTNAAQNLRDMNCTGPIFNKTVLSVCSGILGMNESNGPIGTPDVYSNYSKTMDPASTCQCPATIIMSTDPVSCEMQTIKMMRLNKNPAGKFGVSDMPTYLRASAGISGALSGTVYHIGVIDESQMDVRRIINGTTAINGPAVSPGARAPFGVTVSALPGHGFTLMEYRVPAGCIGKEASIAIYSLNGILLRKQSQTVLGALNHYAWDNKDQAGSDVPAGHHIVHVVSGKTRLSARFFTGRY
ncbi:MAG: DUF362 domain-containing protein [Chitinispirillaceae bacterium]|nr:DUF362 domain-containing protein [Chitinispirillaceae bacterium]